MTLIEKIRETLTAQGITDITDTQIQNYIDNAKALIGSSLIEQREYTDYVRNFNGEVYTTDFYPVLDILEFTIDDKPVTLSHISMNGVLYLPCPYMGTLCCTYVVGLPVDEVEDDLLPLVVCMIRDNTGKNISSISEGDVSVSYNNTTGMESASLDTLVARLRDKYGAMVRLI